MKRMRTKKQRNLLLGLLFLVVLGCALPAGLYLRDSYNSAYDSRDRNPGRLEAMEPLGEMGYVLKYEGGLTVSPAYIAIDNYRLRYSPTQYRSSQELTWTDYVKVDIYEPSNIQKKVKTLDILSLVQDYNKDYVPNPPSYEILQDSESKDYYLQFGVYDMSATTGNIYDLKQYFLYINIETEEIIEDKVGNADNPPQNLRDVGGRDIGFSSKKTSVSDKLEKYGLNEESYYYLDFKEGADLSGSQLAKQYPKAAALLSQGARIIWFGEEKTLAELLGQEDEPDIFQGVTLYGEYSKDGQNHVVQSYDDLMTWYQVPE